jgi:hypothetical protein
MIYKTGGNVVLVTFSTGISNTGDNNDDMVKTNIVFKQVNLNTICAYSITDFPAVLKVSVTKFPVKDSSGGCYAKAGFKRAQGKPLRCFWKAAGNVIDFYFQGFETCNNEKIEVEFEMSRKGQDLT